MKTIFVNTKEIKPKWYLIDATGLILGRLAVKVANVLRGKDKPYFAPHQEVGDFVIITNADKIAVTGRKRKNKIYYRHTGYPGGIRSITLEKVLTAKPAFPLEKAIKGMLPKNRLGRKIFHNVKIYAGSTHPHGAQQPEVMQL